MRTIAITSGKGGVGKSTIAANLSIALAEQGKRVVLFDADLQLANLDVLMGIEPEFTLQHVVAEKKTLREVLTEGPLGVRVASGGSAVSMLMHAGPKRMGRFISQLTELERDTDFIIFDTGAGIDNKVMTFLRIAQEAIIVVTPDPTSVTDAYATAKIALKRDPKTNVKVLLNMVSHVREGQAVFTALESIAWSFLKAELGYVGCVRNDFSAAAAVRKRKPFMVSSPDCSAAEDIRSIAKHLISKGMVRQPLQRVA